MKLILATMFLFASINVYAATWITASGTVKQIVTYAHTETILVNISVEGANVGECSNKSTFAISASNSPEGRARMYSMLLSAQATGRVVSLSFLNEGGCEPWFSAPNIYRKIAIIK
jgi:hypothetical protein